MFCFSCQSRLCTDRFWKEGTRQTLKIKIHLQSFDHDEDLSLSLYAKLTARFGKDAMEKLASGDIDLSSKLLLSENGVILLHASKLSLLLLSGLSTPKNVRVSNPPAQSSLSETPRRSISPPAVSVSPQDDNDSSHHNRTNTPPVFKSRSRPQPPPHQTHGAKAFGGRQYIYTPPVDPGVVSTSLQSELQLWV